MKDEISMNPEKSLFDQEKSNANYPSDGAAQSVTQSKSCNLISESLQRIPTP